MSDWPSSAPRRGTVLPVGPARDQEFYWDVDATNHVTWHMIYDSTLSVWLFLGGPPLYNMIATSETTTSTTYAALTTPGPSIALPGIGGGLYVVGIGANIGASGASGQAFMSFDIGGTGAVDGDAIKWYAGNSANAPAAHSARLMRKQIADQVTLTAKYKSSSGAITCPFFDRYMSLLPVQVDPS